jgi:hypothetical protein
MRHILAVLFVVVAALPAGAVDQPKSTSEPRRDRINKVWDAQLEKIRNRQIAAGCKAEAKKRYSAIHFKKRRMFAERCIDEAQR